MVGALGWFAAIVLAVFFAYFALLNQVRIEISFGPFLPPQGAFLHEVAGVSAAVGALISMGSLLGALWKSSRTIRALRRQARGLEEQNRALREAGPAASAYAPAPSSLPSGSATMLARSEDEPV